MNEILRWVLISIGVAMVLALLALVWVYRRLQRLNIPPHASFMETMQRLPLSVAVGLDVLDLGFDVFAAPLTWWLLGRFNLYALRRVSTVEALIPGTQLIPTLTVCWFAARWLDPAMRGTEAHAPSKHTEIKH